MKILILGSSGMVGNMLVQELSLKFNIAILQREKSSEKLLNFYKRFLSIENVYQIDSINNVGLLKKNIDNIKPTVIINCVGVIKQRVESENLVNMININSLLPHILDQICAKREIKLIHLSTDCVFSGVKGDYLETDKPDPVDYYGQTKLLGEIPFSNALTIRTSFIGPELFNKKSLFEWILSQKGNEIEGYKNAIYSGLTTLEFARIMSIILYNFIELDGVVHISSSPITKYDLIKMINNTFDLNIDIKANYSFKCNRSLNCNEFYNKTKINVKSWNEMIIDLNEKINRDSVEKFYR